MAGFFFGLKHTEVECTEDEKKKTESVRKIKANMKDEIHPSRHLEWIMKSNRSSLNVKFIGGKLLDKYYVFISLCMRTFSL